MIPLRKLRQMRDAVRRFATETNAYADGSWDDGMGGWSDRDEANRSLHEAWIYLSGWVGCRERTGRDPVKGGSLK